jgi:predicted Zn-dependent peptidase
MSSRLFQNVREKKGLAYSVYSMTGTYRDTGVFAIGAGIARDKVDEALDAIRYEIDRLRNESIGEEEFSSGKEQIKSSYIFGLESVQSRMIANGRSMLMLGRCIPQEEQLAKFDSITLDDVEEVKSLICDYDSYSIVNVTGKK